MAGSHQPRLFSATELAASTPTPWEQADAVDVVVAQVVFNRPLTTVFSYAVPEPLRELIRPGQRVEAPFGAGNRRLTGYCVGVEHAAVTGRPLKSLLSILDREPIVTPSLLDLTAWIARRYLCGWGQVLQVVVPAGVKNRAGTREVTHFQLAAGVAEQLAGLKLPAKQRAVLQALVHRAGPMTVEELSHAAQCGTSPIQTLRERGLIVARQQRVWSTTDAVLPTEARTALTLTREQQAAVTAIHQSLQAREHATYLLHGVTGSGKTEVYIRAIEETVSYGRQAIVLVPEISLTPQTIRRFSSRFPHVAVLHSHLTDAERHAHWQRIASGQMQVVVGARSAVFAPTPQLGLIVIDEEHENSFKQDSTPRYHAREVARERARLAGVPLVLGSATPTLESWLRVQNGEDRLLSLPHRVAERPLPPVHIVDLRDDPHWEHRRGIGRALLTAMQEALRAGGQIILFLNVRGFSPLLLCRGCGQAVRCPDCDLTLTWHEERQQASCHTCGHTQPAPERCGHCGKPGLRYFGVGTERLEMEVRRLFPKAACLRMDSDTMQGRGSHDAALEAFRRGDVSILLGTQMIAKGLDFPNVTLVGVIDADTSLRQPDLRARERTFQLIAQVAGRTGRGPRGGQVLVQTSCPDDPAIQFAARHDYLGFARAELAERQAGRAPPYTVAARLIVRGPTEAAVSDNADRLKAVLQLGIKARGLPIRLLGPCPCPILRLQGRFRYHLQLMSAAREPIQELWEAAAADLTVSDGVEFVIDVDPLSSR